MSASRKEEVAGGPGEDADEDRLLVAQMLEHQCQKKEKYHIGNLRQTHPAGAVLPPQFAQERRHIHEVKIEGDTDEKHTDDEDSEGRFLQQRQRVQTQNLTDRNVLSHFLGRSVRQSERENSKCQ